MYSAIIVDDEKWIVEGIRIGVNWGNYGFEVVGDAENGQEALQLIEQLHPDLVLTDIKMPIMNGLELIKRGKEISPNTQFIVLSGHAEFAYAQKALNYGTIGYCLKPFEIDEIHSTLGRLVQSLHNRKIESQRQPISNELHEAICSGALDKVQELLITSNFSVSEKTRLIPVVLQFEGFPELTTEHPYMLIRMGNKRHGCLLYEQHLETFLTSLKASCLQSEYSIGLGTSCSQISELEDSLEAASHAAYGLFTTGTSGIYNAPTVTGSTIEFQLRNIMKGLELKDRVKFLADLEETRVLFRSGQLFMKDAYVIFTAVLYLFTRDGIQHTHIKFFDGYEQLHNHFQHVDVMLDYLITHTNAYFSESATIRFNEVSHKKIKEILHFIHDNFNQEISIQSLSEKYYLSPNYICQLFKREVGENFVEYLSRLRIQYACKLLAETDLSIKHVGEKSGFNDYFYFTRIFKRINQMTPTQFREKSMI